MHVGLKGRHDLGLQGEGRACWSGTGRSVFSWLLSALTWHSPLPGTQPLLTGQPGREQWLAQREAFRKRAVAPEPRFSGLRAFHCWQGSPEISPIVPTSEQTLACAGEGAAASAASLSPALSEESLPAGLVSTWKAGLGRLAFGGERAGLVTLRHMVRTPLRCEPKGVSARPRARGALPARGSEAAEYLSSERTEQEGPSRSAVLWDRTSSGYRLVSLFLEATLEKHDLAEARGSSSVDSSV